MFGRFSKILVVDDSAVQRRIMRGLLESLGYDNIEEASDGGAALHMLAQQTFRLVLSDWDMAPMNGLELLQRMRAEPRWMRTPFIMATTKSQRKFAEIPRDDGATHFLVKPFTADMLAERMTRVDRLVGV